MVDKNDKNIEEWASILQAGGGLRIDGAVFSIEEMEMLASAAAAGNTKLVIEGISVFNSFPTEDLEQMVRAGRGAVEFSEMITIP